MKPDKPNSTLPPPNVKTQARSARSDEDDFSIAEVWRVLRTRKWVIAWTAAAALAAALGISLLMTPKYLAVSSIEINNANSDMLGLGDTATQGIGDELIDQTVELQTEANVIKSDTLALQVIEHLNLEAKVRPGLVSRLLSFVSFGSRNDSEAGLPLEKAHFRRMRILNYYHRNLSVEPEPGTRMVKVSYLDPDPELATAVVNELVSDYLEQYFQTRYTATAQASGWLSKQLSDLKSEVEASQEKLVKYQEQYNILGGGAGATDNVVMVKLAEMNKEVSEAEANRIIKESVYRLTQTQNPELISGIAGTSLVEGAQIGNPSQLTLLQTLRAQQVDLQGQYALAAGRYGPAYPRLAEMRSQLKVMNDNINAEIGKIAARAKNDYLAAKSAEDALRASFKEQEDKAYELNDHAIQYTILKQEADSEQTLYDSLLSKLKEAGILSGLHSTNILLVDPARPAALPVRPNYRLNLALGLVGGLLGGVGLAFLLEGMDDTIRTPEQVEGTVRLPCLGIVPRFLARPKFSRRLTVSADSPPLKAAHMDEPRMAEAYRAIRTALLLSNVDVAPKVIMVTSSLPTEGKTTTSLNLAIALAQQAERVLLIEADLRRPTLSDDVGAGSGFPDLTSMLMNRGAISPGFLQYPPVPSLFMLLAGDHRPPNPAEMMASMRMKECLEAWRSEFDFIVIDTPPVLSVTDAVVLSRHADAVLIVVRAEQTTKQSLLRTRDLLQRVNAPVVGVVINAVDLTSPDYYSYYGYSYTSKYGQGYQDDVQK